MPRAWRVLKVVHEVSPKHHLPMELADFLYSYNLTISGSGWFLTQLKSKMIALVKSVKACDRDWRSKYFFVNLASCGDVEKDFLVPFWEPTST